MGGVTVCVATFGDRTWARLADERAVPSATGQAPVIQVHGDTLHGARNEALRQVETDHVVFLDADDELEPGYVDALAAGGADLRVPSVRYIRGSRAYPPRMPRVAGHRHACTTDCLPEGNWLVVGTLAPTELLLALGGWEPWPVYEDWALWLRCWGAGATVEAIPSAVYRAHVRQDSRNRAPSRDLKLSTHAAIRNAVVPRSDGVAA